MGDLTIDINQAKDDSGVSYELDIDASSCPRFLYIEMTEAELKGLKEHLDSVSKRIDELTKEPPMDKFERFACGQLLCEWPNSWSFNQVIASILDGYTDVHPREAVDGLSYDELADALQSMAEQARATFS